MTDVSKKIAGIILLLALTVSLLASCGNIEYAVISEGNTSSDGFVYTLYENNTAVITGGTTQKGKLIIPASVDGYTVTEIGDSAFEGDEGLYYLKIETPSVKIGNYSFSGCQYLTYADLGTAVSIGKCAFYDCPNLTACDGCENVTDIASMAFLGCASLCSFSFGEKLKTIGNEAFSCCASLPGITLPSSLSSLGTSAFSFCTGLAYADVSALATIPESCFEGCTVLSQVVFSPKLKTIEALSFRSCTSLYSLTLPKNLKSVGENAFAVCSLLTEINYAGSEKGWAKIDFESGNEDLSAKRPYCNYKAAAENKSTGALPLSDRGTAEGSYSGSGFKYSLYADKTAVITGLESAQAILTIPESIDGHRVVGIGDSAFEGSSTLSSVNLGSTLEFIGEGAFYSCLSLTQVSGGEGLKSVGYCAFKNTAYLENSQESFVTLGPVLLAYKGADTAVRIPEGIAYIGAGAFLANYSITSVFLGDNVVTLGDQAFSFCTSLRYVSGKGLRYIGSTCFAGCEKLNAFAPGANIAFIGTYAFADCVAFRYFCPGSGINTLEGDVFQSDLNLRVLCLPDSLTKLYSSAFTNCISFMILYSGSEEQLKSVIDEDSSFYISDMFTVYNYSY